MGLFAGLVLDRNERMKKDLKYSLETRLTTYSLTFDIIKENPLSGIGYGGFLSSFRHHYAKEKEENSLIETIGNNNMSHPHNEFLFWTVEGGIIPFIGMLIIFFAFIIMIWKTKKQRLANSWNDNTYLDPYTIGITFLHIVSPLVHFYLPALYD